MDQELNLEPLFKDTTIPYEDQKQISKNFIRFTEELSIQKNKEFGLYLLELLKEYPEIIPEKSELNFFFEDLERELNIDIKDLEKIFD
jgi:hypothetical protein